MMNMQELMNRFGLLHETFIFECKQDLRVQLPRQTPREVKTTPDVRSRAVITQQVQVPEYRAQSLHPNPASMVPGSVIPLLAPRHLTEDRLESLCAAGFLALVVRPNAVVHIGT